MQMTAIFILPADIIRVYTEIIAAINLHIQVKFQQDDYLYNHESDGTVGPLCTHLTALQVQEI